MLYNDPALISAAAKTLEQDEVVEALEPLDANIVEDLSEYEKGRAVYEANHPLDQKKPTAANILAAHVKEKYGR